MAKVGSVSNCLSLTYRSDPPTFPRLNLRKSLALSFHNLTNPFSGKAFLFTSIQNPPGVTPVGALFPLSPFACRASFLAARCLPAATRPRHFPVSPVDSVLTKNSPASPLDSALTKNARGWHADLLRDTHVGWGRSATLPWPLSITHYPLSLASVIFLTCKRSVILTTLGKSDVGQ